MHRLVEEGRHQQDLGNLRRASEICREALACDPFDAEANFLAGDLALRTGEEREALSFLTRADEQTANLPVVLNSLAEVYLRLGHYFESEKHYTRLNQALPDSPDAMRNLAHLRRILSMHDEAAVLFEEAARLEPDSVGYWLELAEIYALSYDRFGETEAALGKALAIAPDDPDVFLRVARHHLADRRFCDALLFYEKLDEAAPDKPAHPLLSYERARALKGLGRDEEAVAALMEAKSVCDQVHLIPEEVGETGWQELAVLNVRIFLALGDREGALEAARKIAARHPPETYAYDPRAYLSFTPKRLQRLERFVRGRDVVVLAHGPSVLELESRIHELAGRDIFFVSFNRFPQVEKRILAKIGRNLDAIVTTNPRDFRDHEAEIFEFCERPEENLAVLTNFATNGGSMDRLSDKSFAEVFGPKLIFITSRYSYPPIPADPLHFPAGNTLSVVLPFLMLGCPRRIFIFGADGGGSSIEDERAYFFSDMARSAKEKTRVTEMFRRLRIEAIECDRNVEASSLMISALFDVPIPPIYNCSPTDNHELFLKMSYDHALATIGT